MLLLDYQMPPLLLIPLGLTCNNATHPVVLSFLCWFGIPQLTMPKQQVLCVEG